MTREEHLLTILMEECAEVIQRASKALRFGLAEVQAWQTKTNAQRLMDEVNDFIGVYQMIAGPVVSPTSPLFACTPEECLAAIRAKRSKVEHWLAYSFACGTLTKGA